MKEDLKQVREEEKALREKRQKLQKQMDSTLSARKQAREKIIESREEVLVALSSFKEVFGILNLMLTRGKANGSNIVAYRELTENLLGVADSLLATTDKHQHALEELLENGG